MPKNERLGIDWRSLAAEGLQEVLPGAAIEEPGLFLYFPRRAAMAPKLGAFIETARIVLKLGKIRG